MNVLELRGVVAGYGATTVLRGVSLAVPAGAVVAVLGPNGAGKTTLLRAASRLLPLRAGTLLLDGEDVSRWPTDRLARAGVCHVPEGRGVFRQLTVRENLALQVRRDAGAAIERATEAFPIIGERLDQVAGTLSGGEQQMLALARAYVGSPRVMLLDEVSMGLAPIVVDAIFDFLERAAAEGVSLVLVEQYVQRALALADVVHVLGRGEVTFAGAASDVDERDIHERYFTVR